MGNTESIRIDREPKPIGEIIDEVMVNLIARAREQADRERETNGTLRH